MTGKEYSIDPLFQSNPNGGKAPSEQLWYRLENKLDEAKYLRKLRLQRWISAAAISIALIAAVSLWRFHFIQTHPAAYDFTIEELVNTEIESDLFFQDVLYLASLEGYGKKNRALDEEDNGEVFIQ